MSHERLIRKHGRLCWEIDGTVWPIIAGGAEPEDAPPDPGLSLDPDPGLPPVRQPAPSPTEAVEIGGQTFHLTPEAAEALRAELGSVSSVRDELETTRGELDQMRGTWDRLQRVFQPEPQQDDLNTQYYVDPAGAMQNQLAPVHQELAQLRRERFFASFYKEYPELDGMDDVVDAVLYANPDLARSGNNTENRKQLAEIIRTRASAIAQKFGGGGAVPPLRVVESGDRARRGAAPPAPEAPPQPTTLSSILQGRREARRQARRGA